MKIFNYCKLIAVITLIFVSISIKAQIETDRPGQSNNPKVLQKGSYQVESGLMYQQVAVDPYTQIDLFTIPTVAMRFALDGNIDAKVTYGLGAFKVNEVEVDKYSFGVANTSFGLRARISPKANKNNIWALYANQSIRTGTGAFSDGVNTTELAFIGKLTGNQTSVTTNIGLAWQDFKGLTPTFTLAIGRSINSNISMFVESYGFYDNALYPNFDTGFSYIWNGATQVDFSVGTGLKLKNNFIAIGFSKLFVPNTAPE